MFDLGYQGLVIGDWLFEQGIRDVSSATCGLGRRESKVENKENHVTIGNMGFLTSSLNQEAALSTWRSGPRSRVVPSGSVYAWGAIVLAPSVVCCTRKQ
jgi:hypothetical protein